MPSSPLEVVDVSAKLGCGDSPDIMDVEGFGSDEIESPEPAGFAVSGPCDCEDEGPVVGGWLGAI